MKAVNWAEHEYSKALNGKKAAVISPYAKSVASFPEGRWGDMEADRKSIGDIIYTNVICDEKMLPDTKPINHKNSEMESEK